MANPLAVPPASLAQAADALGGVLAALGKPCRLSFAPLESACPNCLFDSLARASSGTPLSGGPQPFTNGFCPVCRGAGTLTVPQGSDVVAIVYRSAADFFGAKPANLLIPAGHVVLKFAAADLPAFLRARTLRIQPALAAAIRWDYEPAGEPADCHSLVPGRFYQMAWKRVPLAP